MKLKLWLISLLIMAGAVSAECAKRSNYNTDACSYIVTRANARFDKGKYAEAKVLYEEALATGDGYFRDLCQERIKIANTMLAGAKKKSEPVPQFTLSQDTVRINHVGGDYPIFVNGKNWNASIPQSEDWCKIEVDRKRGLVKIYSEPNESTESKSTIITVKNGNGRKKTIEVISEGAPEVLRSSASNLVFTPAGETNVVDIDANTDWKLADVPGWLKAVKGNGDIRFTASPNDENRDRLAQVRVETPNQRKIVINILQGAALDSLAFSKNDLTFGPEGGDEYIKVYTDADDWRFGDFPHWCQLERIDDSTIRVHCTPNQPVNMPREASLNVTNGSQTLGINVFQDPMPIVHLIPTDGIGGRAVSFGFSGGYLYPMIGASSSSDVTYSALDYGQRDNRDGVSYSSSGGFVINTFADLRLYKNLYLNAGLSFRYFKYNNHKTGLMTIRNTWGNVNTYDEGEAVCNFKENYTSMSLAIPVLASYRIPLTKTSHIRINAGPVLDFGFSYKLDFSGKANSNEMKRYEIIGGHPVATSGSYTMRLNYSGSCDMFGKEAEMTRDTSSGPNHIPTPEKHQLNANPFNRVNVGIMAGIGYEFMGISLDVSYQLMCTNQANRSFWNGDRIQFFSRHSDLMKGYTQHNNLLTVTVGYTFRY